ncbi:hypothetical protein Bbelb_304150 [Branchiostoma belcheri]|nr:hypothetical protein Bbelb_304150 [Branchiostoma belcheri]
MCRNISDFVVGKITYAISSSIVYGRLLASEAPPGQAARPGCSGPLVAISRPFGPRPSFCSLLSSQSLDLTATRPNCKSRSEPYRKPHGSRRETDRTPDGSLRRTLGVMTPAGVYTEDIPNGRRFKCDLSVTRHNLGIFLWPYPRG